jgi:GTPase
VNSSTFRSGYVAIVGWPNVGKSTLINAIVGFKLSIVSPKAQTTRDSILGIHNEKDVQMIFVDTPGWLKPIDDYQSTMKRAIMRSVYDDADVLVWLIEPKISSDEEKLFGDTLKKTGKPLIVVINKTDMAGGSATTAEKWAKETLNVPVHLISARTGAGVKNLRQTLQKLLPLSAPYFPTDQITDRWERFYVEELIREKIFEIHNQEIPHACAVVLEEFVEKPGRKDLVKVNLFVETDGQKKILIGKNGIGIRFLGEKSRIEIEKQLGRPIFLELLVKVKKNWRKDSLFLKQLEDPRAYR